MLQYSNFTNEKHSKSCQDVANLRFEFSYVRTPQMEYFYYTSLSFILFMNKRTSGENSNIWKSS